MSHGVEASGPLTDLRSVDSAFRQPPRDVEPAIAEAHTR